MRSNLTQGKNVVVAGEVVKLTRETVNKSVNKGAAAALGADVIRPLDWRQPPDVDLLIPATPDQNRTVKKAFYKFTFTASIACVENLVFRIRPLPKCRASSYGYRRTQAPYSPIH